MDETADDGLLNTKRRNTMARRKYEYKTKQEFQDALRTARREATAMQWITRAIIENRHVEFWISEDGESSHFYAARSPRNHQIVFAYVTNTGSMHAYEETQVCEMANDHVSYYYLTWAQAYKRAEELLQNKKETVTA